MKNKKLYNINGYNATVYDYLNENLLFTLPKAIVKKKYRLYDSSITTLINENKTSTYSIEPGSITNVLKYLKDTTLVQYKQLLDIVGVDYPEKRNRFELNYLLLSTKYNKRMTIKIEFNEIYPVDTVTKIYNSAGWYEREIWDLLGIYFSKHPDLRRILTDYGFQGHPLRKDFPLIGYEELRYDNVVKNIVSEPVEMSQKFRFFNFNNPWK
jgi:NADH/F420H2 dehydrogenase subunit C